MEKMNEIELSENVLHWIKQLSLEEKARLVGGKDDWRTHGIDAVGIPSIMVSDGPHGLRKVVGQGFGKSVPATSFPSESTIGASWNVSLLEEVGRALGKECQANGIQVLLGPGVNMKRSPLCGRNFEYYSEDPVLSGKLAAAFIHGVQREGVGACLKHFACNNQEYERMTGNSIVDERTLREIYLPAFEIAIKEAAPWFVMAAYNQVNGSFASESAYLLNDILVNEWNYKGIVVSDWGAVYNRVASLKAGLHLEMPANKSNEEVILKAIRSGELEESVLDGIIKRLLTIVELASKSRKPSEKFDKPSHHQISVRAAEESIVLLKNEENILPLNVKQGEQIALIGGFAQNPRFQGGGSSQVNPTSLDSLTECLLNELGKEVKLEFASGYGKEHESNVKLLQAAVTLAKSSSLALICVGLPDHFESEGYDRSHMDLPASHKELILKISEVQPNCIVLLSNGSPVEMSEWIDQVKAVISCGLPGQGGGTAISGILSGRVNPSGKLSETYPLRLEDNPSFLHFPGYNRNVHYAEGIFTGYRFYEKTGKKVLFPFGHGLSYTTFNYKDLKLSKTEINETEDLKVSLTITNSGKIQGKEIVQLYVRDSESNIPRPRKELKAFAKIDLPAGQSGKLEFILKGRDFMYFDPDTNAWVAENGKFEILAGSSSEDIRLSAMVNLKCTEKKVPQFDKYSSIGEIMEDKHGKTVILPLARLIAKAMDKELETMTEKDFMYHIVMNMPIAKMVNFGQGFFGPQDLENLVQRLNNRTDNSN